LQLRLREVLYSLVTGFFTATLASLVGLGGAELRISFLLYLLKLSVREMVHTNMMISLLVSGTNLLLRIQSGVYTYTAMVLAGAMMIGSIPGALLGAYLGHIVGERRLKLFIAGLLSVVVARLVVEHVGLPAVVPLHPSLSAAVEFVLAVAFGFAIGGIAAFIGVAGGEYRIPVLMFIFGLPIKLAGTASQLVSIPTLVAGLVQHGRLQSFSPRAWRTFFLMGMGSLVGVLLGTRALVVASDMQVAFVFAGILVYTITRLIRDALGAAHQP
jgi:uncharacterized membrane protein YfcA